MLLTSDRLELGRDSGNIANVCAQLHKEKHSFEEHEEPEEPEEHVLMTATEL